MKKLISLMLALILVCSLLPLSAMANTITNSSTITKDLAGGVPNLNDSGNTLTYTSSVTTISKKPGYTGSIWEERPVPEHPSIMDHDNLSWNFNTKYHWKQCVCGCRLSEERHVKPQDAVNDTCICGYHFSDNADLVTLWIKGCPEIKDFDKDTTEYKLNAYTYKDVKEIKISTRTYDSEATVELP